jgi:glutamate N-acetyltransferase/amino-acid N-acetyltransferase
MKRARFREIPGSVVAPRGFLASGVRCGIQRPGAGKGARPGERRDLALIVSETEAVAAGMYTTNQVQAAPVRWCIPLTRAGRAQAIVANSGNANACTGARGARDARAMAQLAGRRLLLPPERVLVASTGRIGLELPMDRVAAGIADAAALLGDAEEHAAEAAEAILTSDTHPKSVAVEFRLGGRAVRIGGIAKGAGMIQPGMSATGKRPAALPHATMLCFLTTDAAVGAPALRAALKRAVAGSFNRITVDGDMSTNDTVLVLANGQAGHPRLTRVATGDGATFAAALEYVCGRLAGMIVRDGEGVHRVVTVRVTGAASGADAEAAVRAVAGSALVKSSWHGGDPNWGRVLDALGYSAARVVEERVDIGYSSPGSSRVLWAVRRGRAARVPFARLWHAVQPAEFDLHVNLNLGRGGATLLAADLTEAYVAFNKGTLSGPDAASALGG